jgi:hypothetical protein
MKNRNIPYYMAVLALAAGMSTSFVSCVDTEEPETVEQLRKEAIAKIQADTKLQNALADVQAALKAKTDAEAKKIEAEAAYKDAETRAKDAEAEKQEIQNKIDSNQDVIDAKVAAAVQEKLKTAELDRKAAIENKKNADKEAALAEAKLADEIAKAKAELVSSDYGKGQYTDIETAYNKYLDAVEEYGKAQDEYVAKVTAEKKDLAKLTQDVANKTTALRNAEEAKAKVEAVYNTEDYKAWEKEYNEAKEALAKAETAKKTLEKAKAVADADVEKRKGEVKADLNAYKAAKQQYVYGESDGATENLQTVVEFPKDGEQITVKVDKEDKQVTPSAKWLDKKVKVFLGDDVQIKNEYASQVLTNVAKTLEDKYDKTDLQIKAEEAAYNADMKDFTEDETSLTQLVLGTQKTDETDEEKRIGRKAWYTKKYNAAKGKEDGSTEVTDYKAAASNFLGAVDGKIDGVALNGWIPSDEEVLADPDKWGTYGNYLKTKKELAEDKAKLDALKNGVQLYRTLTAAAKKAGDNIDSAQAVYDDKISTDADLLAFQKTVDETDAKVEDKEAEITKYKAITKAIKEALGVGKNKIEKDDLSKPIFDEYGNPVLDDEGNQTYEKMFVEGDDLAIAENISLADVKAEVLAGLQKAIDDAQADLDAAEEDVKEYKAGNRDSNAAVTRAKSKADEKKMAMDDAKAKLDAVKAAYGVKAE